MAKKLPTLEDVWKDPTLLLQLPPSIASAFLDSIRRVAETVETSTKVEPDPISMALTVPRYRWMDAPHLHYLSAEIATAVDSHSAIIVTMPPRHAKSFTCSVWTPFWFLARRPEEAVMLVSAEGRFARSWGVRVRSLIELYGERYGLHIDPKKSAGDDWELTTGGGMKGIGAGGTIAGKSAKLLIVDDAIKNDEQARSDVLRNKIWDWWDATVQQRIEPDTTVIVIGTRYHEDDLIGRLIQHSADGDGVKFTEVNLRAKAEDDDPLGRAPGEGLWTTHPLATGGTWGQEYYDSKEAGVSAYSWNSVYQQRPSPPGGNMIDPEWWSFYRPSELPSKFDKEIQTWDLSLDAEKKTDSYHAGLVMSQLGARIFIRDSFHKHCQAPEVISCIRNWRDIYPGAGHKLVERSLAGPWLIQTLHNEVSGLMPWPPKGTRKGSKEACLNACVPDVRSGNVYLPLNPDGSRPRWVQDFIEELRQFPRAPHDDYVDSFSQGMNFLLPSVRRAMSGMQAEASNMTPVQTPQAAHTASIHNLIKTLTKPKLDRLRFEQRRLDRALLPFARLNTAAAGGANRRSNRGMW